MNLKCKKQYFIIYTIVFTLLALLIYAPFLYYGKSMVFSGPEGGGDGISQHFTALAYFGRYLRTIFRNIVIEHRWEIPMWEMGIGYGSDIITTLNYYVLGDPFALLSVFFPVERTELLYNALIVLRLYFAGIAFSCYCRYSKQDEFATLIGSYIYVFCGYGLLAPILHPYFANPMIWFPLILLGVEKILDRTGPRLYVGMMAVAALSNFYFFYMICIMVVIYTIFRYFMVIKDRSFKTITSWVIRFVGYSVLAVGIAMVLLLPAISSMIGMNRVEAGHLVPRLYGLQYYKSFMETFVTASLNGYYTYMGYAALAVCAMIILFGDRKQNVLWKYYLGLLTLFLLVPYAGHLMNGFAYVTNRWIWAYSFLISFLTVQAIPRLFTMQRREKAEMIVACLIYVMAMVWLNGSLEETRLKLACFFIMATAALLLWSEEACTKWGMRRIKTFCLLGLVSANIIANAWFAYLPRYYNYLINFQQAKTAWEAATQSSPNGLIRNLSGEKKPEQRYDTVAIGGESLLRNSAMLMGLNGTSLYFSTSNNRVSRFQREMFLNFNLDQSYENLDGRSALTAVNSVRYEVAPKGAEKYLPYGFDKQVNENAGYTAYENISALPMAYWYPGGISRASYENMSVTEKQQAILQGAVLDGSPGDIPQVDVLFTDSKVPFQVTEGRGLQYQNNKFLVTEPGASAKITFEGRPRSETYVITQNLQYESDRSIVEPIIRVSGNDIGKAIAVKTPENNYYCGRHDFLVNMGYSEEALTCVDLEFISPGVYQMDYFGIVCQPLEPLEQYKNQLDVLHTELYRMSDNRYQCKTVSEQKGILCLAVPYSQGWSAEVDGEAARIIPVNTMYIGIDLEPGEHLVQISYETPYIKLGASITLISLLKFFMLGNKCISRGKGKSR